MTVEQLYAEAMRTLPVAGQLRLAALILQQFADPRGANYSEEWTDKDLRDFTAAGLKYVDEQVPDEGYEDGVAR